jgi:hypothetical protein
MGRGGARKVDFQWDDMVLQNPDLHVFGEPLPRRRSFVLSIKKMPGDKASGPDGFTGLFYKKFWETIKADIMRILNLFGKLLASNCSTPQMLFSCQKGGGRGDLKLQAYKSHPLHCKVSLLSTIKTKNPHLNGMSCERCVASITIAGSLSLYIVYDWRCFLKKIGVLQVQSSTVLSYEW